MKFHKTFTTIDAHTAGHPERIITGGLPPIPGNSMTEKRDYIREKLDFVRKILTNEPRGHASMHCAYITEPVNKEADIGVIFFGAIHYGDMCGHGTIAVVTALIETGIIAHTEGKNVVKLDVPGVGLVTTSAEVKNDRVLNVTLTNTPSFLFRKDVRLEVPSIGSITGDIAYGGNWYFYVRAEDLNMHLRPEEISTIIAKASLIKEAAYQEFELTHPTLKTITEKLLGVIISEKVGKEEFRERNILVIGPRHFDRSPCGTGTCGKVAIWFAEGKLKEGQQLINEGVLGTYFTGRVAEVVKLGTQTAVVPTVTGSAYITGFHQFFVDPEDPLGNGFYV